MQATKKKLMLVPVSYGVKSLAPREEAYVRIMPAYKTMHIGTQACEVMALNGKFYRLFYDIPNSVIAWQIRDNLSQEQIDSKTWKLAKLDKAKQIVIGIGRILDVLGASKMKSTKLEVQKWLARKDSILEDGDYYFVELKENKDI